MNLSEKRLPLLLAFSFFVVVGIVYRHLNSKKFALEWAEARDELNGWAGQHELYFKSAEAAREGEGLELIWYGDSITECFRSTSLGFPSCPGTDQVFKEVWGSRFRTDVFAISGDQTSHLAWRLLNGEGPEGLDPVVAVVMIGTNDMGRAVKEGLDMDATARQAVVRVEQIVRLLLHQDKRVHVVLQALLPRGSRGDSHDTYELGQPSMYSPYLDRINADLERFASGIKRVTYKDCGKLFLTEDGLRLKADIIPDALHPNAAGMEELSRCLEPVVVPLLEEARRSADGGGGTPRLTRLA